MRRRWLLLGCVGMAWLGACGAGEEDLSAACTERAGVERALAAAPEPVRLADGTSIARCIADAGTPGLLQSLGATLTPIAEDLEARAASDPAAAMRLGYLIGAARRGSARSDGLGAEIVRRLERSGGEVRDPGMTGELLRGIRAGEETG